MKTAVRKSRAAKSMLEAPGPSGTNQIELPQGMRDRISRKAHGLWQQRGYREGYALQDWLVDAEAILMGGQP